MIRFIFLLLFSMPVLALDYGINLKNYDSIDHVISILKKRNLKTVRVNINLQSASASNTVESATRLKEAGISVEGILLLDLHYDKTCSQDFAKVRQNAYNQTFGVVDKLKYAIYDYELMNESPAKAWLKAEVPQNSGELASAYVGKPCYESLAAGLDGMADAIDDIRTASGLPLRTILGITGRDYGFGLFMINNNAIKIDVIGYHIYSGASGPSYSTDTFWGYGTNTLYARLAQFNKPVRINEFNCAETYSSFDNVVDSTATINCSKAIKKHITDLQNQTTINLESITFYELHDEPQKANPEDRFGLTYNIYKPKLQLATVSALAGGWISSEEKAKLIAQGIMTCQEIVDYKNKAFYDPLKVTVPAVTTCN